MQDEEINNMDEIIREAANSHHPVYDDKAWHIMEALLDQHLPQKPGRKRPVIFYWFLLFITAATIFALLYPWNKKDSVSVAGDESKFKHTSSQMAPTGTQPLTAITITPKALNSEQSAGVTNRTKKETVNYPRKHGAFKQLIAKRSHNRINISGNINDYIDPKNAVASAPLLKAGNDATDSKQPIWPPSILAGNDEKEHAPGSGLTPTSIDSTHKTTAIQVAKLPLPMSKENPLPIKPSSKENAKKGFGNHFAVTFAVGPDLSFVVPDDPGKTRLTYGAGLRYSLTPRFAVSSGFYISNKIYSAKPSDYHPPKGYWTYSTNLQRVDADCKVYEIPLSASYQFKQSKNHNWFAGIGFSSFIMKSETYDYLYKDAMGRNMYKKWTLKNQNKHYFSVLGISGGYQYRVNHNISLIAEPYVKLPLQGIGFGKIKLNSGGLLLTASVQPFAKKK